MTRQVGVIGLGLIGGSVARRLVQNGHHVHGMDTSEAELAAAELAGVVTHDSIGPWVADLDLILVATPLAAMAETFLAVAEFVSPETTLVDAGSAKTAVHDAAASAGLSRQFVGLHPMAGSERSGFDASESGLLVGVTWALTVDSATEPERVDEALEFAVSEFEAGVIVLSPNAHDDAVATISHVPHVLANALLASLHAAPHAGAAAAMAAGSFRDGTRVAGRNTARTLAMLTDNERAVRERLLGVIADLAAMTTALGQPDSARAHAWLEEAARVRADILDEPEESRRVARTTTPLELAELGEHGWMVDSLDAESLELVRGRLNAAFYS